MATSSAQDSDPPPLPRESPSLTQGISFKMAGIGVIVALCLGFLLSSVQVVVDYSEESQNLESQVHRILRVASSPARRAAFELNPELAGEVIQGLIEYEFVTGALIVENSLGTLAEDRREQETPIDFWVITRLVEREVLYSIPLYGPSGATQSSSDHLGRLEITIDQAVAMAPFFRRSAYVIASGVVRSILLATILLVVFHYFIGSSLVRLATRLSKINPKAPTEDLIPIRRTHRNDELGLVSHSVNILLSTIEQHMRELNRSEEAYRESQARFKAFAEAASDWFWESDADGLMTYVSDRFFVQTGLQHEDIIGASVAVLENEDLERSGWAEFASEIANKAAFRDRRCSIKGPNGRLQHFSISGQPVVVSESETRGFRGTASDITQETETESQLRQAQKMQAIGQMTGGVSHDFNNLLLVIICNLELAISGKLSEEEKQKSLQQAIVAADRGAELIRRLLAFSRKQALAPKTIDVNALLRGMDELLRRSLGEHIEIELTTAAGLWQCDADPPQLESALLNLAINARDSMDKGGKLTIETGNVHFDDYYAACEPDLEPGQYVLIAVTDTGTGISPDIMDKIFEPFFTTKDVGHGSGLGLSMVFGFAKQSGGQLNVYSEVGSGTTVKLYLPRSKSSVEIDPGELGSNPIPPGVTRRLLVVEDEPAVLKLVVIILEAEGYELSTATTAAEALTLIDNGLRPDLLLTDAVLPGGKSGADLAKELETRIPRIRILYMSGYTENAIVHGGRLDRGVLLLQKPFRRLDLLRKINQALEGED